MSFLYNMIEFAEILDVFPGFPQRPFFTRGPTAESEACMMIERAISRVLQEQTKQKHLPSEQKEKLIGQEPRVRNSQCSIPRGCEPAIWMVLL